MVLFCGVVLDKLFVMPNSDINSNLSITNRFNLLHLVKRDIATQEALEIIPRRLTLSATCMATRTLVLLLVQLLCVLLCCRGELVLYVQSNSNETACPPGTDPTVNCRLLSEYASDSSLSPNLDLNTTFVFLPGEHVLDSELHIYGASALELRSGIDNTAVITCTQSGYLYLNVLDNVEVSSLNFYFCFIYASFVGNTVFRQCRFACVNSQFSVLTFDEGSSSATFEYCSFEDNTAQLVNVTSGSLYFKGNQITHNYNWWIELQDNSMATLSDNHFTNNTDRFGVLVVFSSLRLTGNNVFHQNSGTQDQGILHCFHCTIVLDGNTTFANNTGRISGVLSGIFLSLFVRGTVHFVGNRGSNGGAMVSQSSQYYFSGNVTFEYNSATYGGAIYLVSSTVTFLNDAGITFIENLAAHGGAIFLASGSSLHFPRNSSANVTFEHNHAEARGGAIFIQDYNAQSYCRIDIGVTSFGPVQICSFLFDDTADETSVPDNLYFSNNCAEEAGSAIYGGSIEFCISNSDGFSTTDQFFQRTVFANTPNFLDFTSSVVSSDPFVLYACDENCTDCSISRTAYPGATVNVTVVALGQLDGAVPATIRAITTQMEIGDQEYRQRIPKQCTTVSYTVYARPGNASSLELFADGPCLTTGQELMVEIEVRKCPPGFNETAFDGHVTCTCDPRLIGYTNSCNPQNEEILHDGLVLIMGSSSTPNVLLTTASQMGLVSKWKTLMLSVSTTGKALCVGSV